MTDILVSESTNAASTGNYLRQPFFSILSLQPTVASIHWYDITRPIITECDSVCCLSLCFLRYPILTSMYFNIHNIWKRHLLRHYCRQVFKHAKLGCKDLHHPNFRTFANRTTCWWSYCIVTMVKLVNVHWCHNRRTLSPALLTLRDPGTMAAVSRTMRQTGRGVRGLVMLATWHWTCYSRWSEPGPARVTCSVTRVTTVTSHITGHEDVERANTFLRSHPAVCSCSYFYICMGIRHFVRQRN